MTARSRPPGLSTWATELAEVRRPSFALSGSGDALILIGIVSVACGLAGLGDDLSDAAWLAGCGTAMLAIGIQLRRRFVRPRRTTPARILRGLGLIWCGACITGAAIYLLTGTVGRIDDALLESTAGFTTTNVTTLDPTKLSRGIILWRAATQWVAGYLAILLSVVAMPEAFKGALQARGDEGGQHLVPDAITGRRRIFALYGGFSVLVVAGYLATGMAGVEAVAHGLATASTGGFSTNVDSFSGYGTGPRTVATIGMLIAGASIFVLWWLVRGRMRPLWRSTELRVYLAIVAAATALIVIDVDGISLGDALFTATSVTSTTGFAVGDWAAWSDNAEGVLLVTAAIGSMLGSAGGGFKVIRAQLLFVYAARSLRQQLDPRAVIVVKHRGYALDESTLHRLTGFQIAQLVTCGAAAVALGSFGMSVAGSVWGATSAVSSLGPAVGEIGSFGSLEGLSASARAVLIPAMLAGRLSIMPALVVVAWALRSERQIWLRGRRALAAMGRRVGREISGG